MALTPFTYRKVFQVIATLILVGLPAWADWPPIPPEDLKMTGLPQQKGAPAVILLREEVADDLNNYHSVYERIKILTEAGRRYADVELPYWRRAFTIDGVSGRTIHADGSIIPFDGQVLDKMALHARRGHIDEVRVHVKAFTLPDVQVGSIIEFRYSLRYADNTFVAPEWLVQQDLFQRRATFKYIPYDGPVTMRHGRIGQGAAWSALLPAQGPQPQLHKVLLSSQASRHQAGQYIDLSIENTPPIVEEPHMPPVGMLRYRVQFYYRDQFNPSPEDFWKEEGKFWSKDVEKFLDDKSGIDDAVARTTLPTDSPEQKVRKIYAFVTGLENQSFRPQRTEREEKGIGLKANGGVEDVLRQRSGTHDDLNRLFAAMVRTAGIPAWMMWVASREETFFQPELMSTHQLKVEIAIVQLGGKDVFLDPGTKYCPYGLLDWQYSGSQGLRQSVSKGTTEFASSPLSDYGQAEIMRLARLQLGEDGKAEGTIKIGFYGLEAMDRRQKAGLTDDAGRKRLLEDEVRKWLPYNSEVTITGAPNWDETEPHLATEFKISVPLATNAGKRWLIPVHIFHVNAKPVFSGSERLNSIYFWYKTRELDEVHLALPPSLEVESLPPNDSVKLDYALYSVSQRAESANSIVARRDFVMGGFAFPASVYSELKGFYDKVKAGDDQQMILRGALVPRPSNIGVRGSLRLTTLWAVLLLAPGLMAATPEWVRKAAAQLLPTYDAETNAAVLLDDVSVTVTGPTEYLEHYRRVVRILRPEGRGEANLYVNLRAHEKVHSIHCWALDRSGKEFELKDKDFAERGVVSGYELYDDARARTGTCPAADPGSVIAFEYEVQRHVWVNEYEWEFQESIPIHESHVVIYLPAGWEYKTLWANGGPIEPSRRGDGGLEWTLRDLPAVDHEPMGLQPYALCRRLGVVYFPPQTTTNAGSWEAVGRWYAQLTVDQRNATPELAERARQLTAGMTDFDSKARALASFLQSDIRYVAIEIGIGGAQPHRAADVFRARYGDCKDKATLLSAMLHAVGIQSDYVLIDTRRGIVVPTLPSPRANHAILAIELPEQIKTDTYRSVVVSKSGKRYLIFDPTDRYTPLGELRGELQDTYALLVADGRGELIHTPLATPDANLMVREGRFTLSAEGSLEGEVVENWSGSHAWHERVYLMRDNEQERSQRLEQRVSRSLSGFTLETFDIKQLDQLQQDLVTSFRFANPGYAQVRGSLMLVRPRVMGEKTLALDRKPRHFPFQFEATSRETDVYEIELPKEYFVDDVPEPVNVDMGFGAYHSKIEVDGRSLRYSSEFLRRDVLIPPDREEDLRKLQSIIGADENASVVLKRVE